MTTLLLSVRLSEDNQSLWRAAIRSGWNVERARGLHLPEGLVGDEVVLCVESLFAHSIAERLSLTLIEPDADWLVRLPFEYRKRAIRLATLGEAGLLNVPAFVKPPNEKSFEAKVYASGSDLSGDYDDGTTVLIADAVAWEVEYRCFVLDRMVRTMSPYLRFGRLAKIDDYGAPDEELRDAQEFAERLLGDRSVEVPRAVVLDIGRITDRGWAAVELNPAWGSGIYGCDPRRSSVGPQARHVSSAEQMIRPTE